MRFTGAAAPSAVRDARSGALRDGRGPAPDGPQGGTPLRTALPGM